MLTAKQEAFVKNIIDGMSQADAYRSAYPNQKMTDKTVWESASKLMKNPKVSARLQELRDSMMKPTIMTAQERLEYLTRVIKGEECEKVAVAVDGKVEIVDEPTAIKTRLNALDIMNKMQGEYTQKIEAEVSNAVNIKIELTDE
jgi:phage terminase small subunit